jgi:O-antigen/teichoic acid export membrane protein
MSSKDNFNTIFKSTFLFGGSQVIGLLASLVRNKFAAVFLGASGMGLNGVFISTLNLVKALTTLGINESAVKEIAKANGSGDTEKIKNTYAVFKFWVYLTGIFGVLALLLFAPYISLFAFKNTDYAFEFQLLSISIVFGALAGGISTYLRGIQQIQLLASSNVVGAIVGLLFTIPFYYFFGIKGIIPSILASSFFTFIISLYFKRKFPVEPVDLEFRRLFIEGGPMVRLGLSLTTVTILSSTVTFVLNSFIIKFGGLHNVGLFNAGTSIIEIYIGMVFTTIAADFFPRLSSVIHEEDTWKKLINDQLELAFILLTIGLVLLVSTAPFLIRLILSEDLMASLIFIYAAVLYVPFKVLVWIPGFYLIAKGENKIFLIFEVIGNILLLTTSILLYKHFSVRGLGYALVGYYSMAAIFTYFLMKYKFDFHFSNGVIKLFLQSFLSVAVCVVLKTELPNPYSIISELIFALIVVSISLKQMNKRVNLKVFFLGLLSRFTKKSSN